jgi:hypothetical protein
MECLKCLRGCECVDGARRFLLASTVLLCCLSRGSNVPVACYQKHVSGCRSSCGLIN